MELVELTRDHDVVVVGKVVRVEAGASAQALGEPVASRGGYHNYFRIGTEHIFRATDATARWERD